MPTARHESVYSEAKRPKTPGEHAAETFNIVHESYLPTVMLSYLPIKREINQVVYAFVD
jgi:hypothetical protein